MFTFHTFSIINSQCQSAQCWTVQCKQDSNE